MFLLSHPDLELLSFPCFSDLLSLFLLVQNLYWRNLLFSSVEKLGDLFSLHKASKISLHFLIESVFKLPEHNTIRERTPNSHLLLSLHLWIIYLLEPCVCFGVSLEHCLQDWWQSFRTWKQSSNQKCCLGAVSSPERDMAACHGLPSFLLVDPIRLCTERQLVLFWITILPNCTLWDLWWFYFTFNQNVIIKSHLDNKKK